MDRDSEYHLAVRDIKEKLLSHPFAPLFTSLGMAGGAKSSGPTGKDIWVLQVEDGKRVEISCTEFFEGWPEFSPDGRWIAYATDETGRFEV